MTQAFILRIAPSYKDRVAEALETDQLIIGWSKSVGLLDSSLTWTQFRSLIHENHYSQTLNLRRAGAAAGHMWRFIHEMELDDLVVVPNGPHFYVAKVTGDALYLPENRDDDTSYRRPVEWLNDKKPIARRYARAALISRMKTYGTSAAASDLIVEIQECLAHAAAGEKTSFQEVLQESLVQNALSHIRDGHMDSFGFESLIKNLLLKMGAKTAKVIARHQDKGADVVATFRVAEMFSYRLAVQAKHWDAREKMGSAVVDQLIKGIEDVDANLGMVITSGEISDSAAARAKEYEEETGIRIELVDGEQFARLLIEQGFDRDRI